MTVDTDKLVSILKKDQPLNVTMVEENGKDKLVILFALPHLIDKIEVFAKGLLEEHKELQLTFKDGEIKPIKDGE